MKKKLNLLWNLKFNFFSVAERPLTFFAYFLNAKKVGRRRLVISPAKAGAFLFSHTRLPFPPRPLLPFSRISPAAKPGWPVTGPTFWVCRAKSGAAFRCAKPPCAVVRFAAMASPPRTAILPFPSRLRRAGAPTAKPRPLLPFGRISPAAKPGWPVTGPTFWVCRAKSGAAFRCAKPPWPMFWPVLFIGQKMRYSVLAGFSSISQCR